MKCTRLAVLALAALASACAATPPANWARGGAPLDVQAAAWVRPDMTVAIAPDGRVTVNGEHVFSLDRGGRVFDADAQPIALLEPDGRVIGPEEAPLGNVGVEHAALPNEATAWISVLPSGEVIGYDEGAPVRLGLWTGGCSASASAHQACTLVTHLVGLQAKNARPRFSIGIGFGIGAGVRLR